MLNFELRECDLLVDILNFSDSLVFLKTTKTILRMVEEIAVLFCLHYSKTTYSFIFPTFTPTPPPIWGAIHGEKP